MHRSTKRKKNKRAGILARRKSKGQRVLQSISTKIKIDIKPSVKIMSTTTNFSEAELKKMLKEKQLEKNKDREAYKELVAEQLPTIIGKLINCSEHIADVKTEVFKDLKDIIELKAQAYGVKEKQQSHTFSLESGESVTIGVRVTDGWDDTVNTGLEKVNRFLTSLATDEKSAKLVDTINRLLKKDAKGNLKANRVLELKKLADTFDDVEFSDGVDIIQASYSPKKSCYFIDANTVNGTNEEVNIPLSISSVDFTEELNFKVTEL